MGRMKLPKGIFKVLFPSKKRPPSSSSSSAIAGAGSREPKGPSHDGLGEGSPARPPSEVPPSRGEFPEAARTSQRQRGQNLQRRKCEGRFSSRGDCRALSPLRNDTPETTASSNIPSPETMGAIKDPPSAFATLTEPIVPSSVESPSFKAVVSRGNHGRRECPRAGAVASPATATLEAANDRQPSPPPSSPRSPPSSSSSKKKFSSRGGDARQRTLARQKRILSKASLRLDAISDTSLESIEEAILNKVSIKAELERKAKHGGAENEEAALNREQIKEELGMKVRGKTAGEEDPQTSFLAIDLRPTSASSATTAVDIGEQRPSVNVVRGGKVIDTSGNVTCSAVPSPWGGPAELGEEAEFPKVEKVFEKGENWSGGGGSEEGRPADESQSQEASSQGKVGEGEHDDENGSNIQFFIILLCPDLRIFELLEISASEAPRNDATLADVLGLIPQKCTDERLLRNKYVGFVRPSDGVDFVDLDASVFGRSGREAANRLDSPEDSWRGSRWLASLSSIREDDVLVAILEGRSGNQMGKICRPILKNSKFRDLIRKRSKGGRKYVISDDNRSTRSKRSSRSARSKGSSSSRRRRSRRGRTSKQPRVIVEGVPDDISGGNGTAADIGPTANSRGSKRHSVLCKKLECLSRKLHDVDDEILADDASATSPLMAPALKVASADTNETGAIDEEVVQEASSVYASFRMTSEMVASELAANIEDVFAGHDVEIVVVDTDDGDSDDDTFVSAQSCRSVKSVRSVRSLKLFETKSDDKPLLEITAKKRPPRKPRKSNFDTYGQDDLMLQIEAMARQADEAFEGRRRNRGPGVNSSVIEPVIESAIIWPRSGVIDENMTENGQSDARKLVQGGVKGAEVAGTGVIKRVEIIDKEIEADAVSHDDSPHGGVSFTDEYPAPSTVSTYVAGQRDAMSQNFLNASASMLSTIVAASEGQVNEVHVLQYLGMTIVCIAANFMQEQGRSNFSTGGGLNPFGVREVFQSAMFLAFMVNGQRYLAKVTKRGGGASGE